MSAANCYFVRVCIDLLGGQSQFLDTSLQRS